MATADELKALGNKAIAEKNFDDTLMRPFSDKFTQAIAIQPENHILYSNRSAAYASKRDWDAALKDAEKTTEIKPDWPKGWGRKGAALHGKGDLLGANDAYEEGLKHDSGNAQLKSGLAAVEKSMMQESGGGNPGAGGDDPAAGLSRMFNDPQLLQKLASNPKTSSYLSDPSFMAKLQQLQKNPQMTPDMFSDPRMIQVLGVMMGVDMEMRDSDPRQQADVDMPDAAAQETKPKPAQKAPEPEPEPEVLDEEALEKKKAKEEADKEKALGTENYKKRNFDEAIKHYTKAWETFKDITYLNNLGAAQFEKGDYDACIEACDKAIQEGREIYADFKVIAKSYARIGTAYERKGDLAKSIENYKKSLTEHRTPDVLNKLRVAEKSKADAAKTAYIDPVKADEAREAGNKKFKESDFPGAVASYTEMIKRAPEDPRGYSNRAAAFIKLFEFPSALDDCDMAIKKDVAFIRAYIRKAQAYFGMRKYSDCVDACTEALAVDTEHHNGANAREIDQQQQKAFAAMYSARDNETEEQTRERLEALLTYSTGDGPYARPCDAVDSAAGSVGPHGSAGAHAEPECADQDSEADCRRRHSCWTVKESTCNIGLRFDNEKMIRALYL
ncbi:heat shock protein [Cordyceps javanica]|uniref:Heat shock protein n=1 Tax=Cordyceps javanica TaxID=43265 RepID=A0A545V3L3_9HYPO|nr:heat shock protein [Cordyceps javanica]